MPIENMYYLIGIILPLSMAIIALFRFLKKFIVDKIKRYIRKIVKKEIKEQSEKVTERFLGDNQLLP